LLSNKNADADEIVFTIRLEDQLIKVKSLFDSFLDFGFRKKVITNQAIEKSEQ